MSQPVKRRRVYDSPRRRDQARATRRAVLNAAEALFVERGYVATTIDAIAARATVSPETVFSIFGAKRTLLSELVDVSISGGNEAPPILEQAWVREMGAEPDPRRRIEILAANGRSILERRSALDEVVRGAAAAEPEMATLWERGKAQRFSGQAALLQMAIDAADLREGLDLETAAEILFAIGSPEVYRLLVVDRGWSGSRFEQWYAETLARLLLEPPPFGLPHGHADAPPAIPDR
ncbi:MAG: helix-turn-helix domain-containing protein [Candidatus Limnocylindrales bacterium]|jgi:AcrR family transcriptional regulator